MRRLPAPRRLAVLGAIVSLGVLLGCVGGAGDTNPNPPAIPAELDSVGQEGSALSAPPVEAGVSIWGRKQPDGLVVTVMPGNNPDADQWHFYLGSRDFSCEPSPEATGWRFSTCEQVSTT